MPENRLKQLVKDIAEGLRRRQVPHASAHVSETYKGDAIGADKLRGVSRGHSEIDGSAAEPLKRIGDGTDEARRSGEEQPAHGHSPCPETHHQDRPDAPLLVANALERLHLSGTRAKWVTYHPAEAGCRKFEAYMVSPTERPLPPLDPDSGLNCVEMLLYAAAQTKAITHAELHRIYAPIGEFRRTGLFPKDWKPTLMGELLPHGKRLYIPGDPVSPQPQRGDVVMTIRGDSHGMVATGRMSEDGSPEVYSFWPAPKDLFTRDPRTGAFSAVTDAVQITSLDELGFSKDVWFGRGPW